MTKSFELTAPTLPSSLPIAHVFGKPVLTLPQDLYIPPDALQIMLQSFDGPLDLLLYLIRRQNLDVLNIPMAQITAQYMDYIEAMADSSLERVADYLLMAAVLIEIKSRLLLPRSEQNELEEENDPRAELVRRLLEYEQIKKVAVTLDKLPQAGRDFQWAKVEFEPIIALPLPVVQLDDLQQAWRALLARARLYQHHQVKQEILSVREQMAKIIERLAYETPLRFEALFAEAKTVLYVVVNFMALLELIKAGMIFVTQAAPFQSIFVQLVSKDQIDAAPSFSQFTV